MNTSWIGLAVLLLLGSLYYVAQTQGICLQCPGFHYHRSGPERSPSASLKTIASAQADFRANDRDEDGAHQFWRGDVAGLYALVPKGKSAQELSASIRLIELSVAGADDRPVTDITRYTVRSPKAGYLFRALRHADEDPKSLAPDRFAAATFPAAYSKDSRFTYILDERNTIFKADLGHGRGIDVYPTVEELKMNWSKLD